jgi:uncharacterized protein YlbG (UPF0298 family)
MSEAYVLLNVKYQQQKEILEKLNQLSTVKSVKTVYGIYDILVVFESDNLQTVKSDIDSIYNNIEGIENFTILISV